MSSICLQILVFVSFLVQPLTEVHIILVEEISLADGDIIELGSRTELLCQFLVQVLVDEVVLTLSHTVDGSGEQSHITEGLRIVGRDIQGVEATHRQTGNGTVLLVGDGTVMSVYPFHQVREGDLYGTLHGLGIHKGGFVHRVLIFSRHRLLGTIAIRHHHNHRLCLALCDEVIEYLCRTS